LVYFECFLRLLVNYRVESFFLFNLVKGKAIGGGLWKENKKRIEIEFNEQEGSQRLY
jgi:hypothetical protein